MCTRKIKRATKYAIEITENRIIAYTRKCMRKGTKRNKNENMELYDSANLVPLLFEIRIHQTSMCECVYILAFQ